MPYFQYVQNNSGGSFDIDIPRGISTSVIVEAKNADQANSIAQDLGIYFDGVGNYSEDEDGYDSYDGIDCPCCGDRWYPVNNSYADKVPSYYDTPLTEDYKRKSIFGSGFRWTDDSEPSIIVHHLDGRIIGYDPYLEISGGK